MISQCVKKIKLWCRQIYSVATTVTMDLQCPVVYDGDTLYDCVRSDKLVIAKKLLDKHCVDVNATNSKNKTPLHLACELKKGDFVTLLIAFGADPFIEDSDNETSYDKSNHEIYGLIDKLLFHNDLWIDGPASTNGDTSLHTAIRSGNFENVEKVIEQGVGVVHDTNSSGESPLHLACALGDKPIVHLLMSNGADMYKRDCYNNVPIHRAVAKGHIEIIDLLTVTFGCPPKTTGYQGRTLLHFACAIGNVELVNIMIRKYGFNPCECDSISQTPLHVAASHGQNETMNLLITSFNCPVDIRARGGYTPLHLACYCGHTSTVKKLIIDHDANFNACDSDFDTPLHKAALGGHTDILQMLIKEFYCSPQVKGFADRSLLHHASANGHTKLSLMLITDYNLDPLLGDANGNTSLHLACVGGHDKLACLLIAKFDCIVDARNGADETPLIIASLNGHYNLVRLLLNEFKADINAKDNYNSTVLHNAALGGHTALVIKLIKEFHCDPQMKGFRNRSLLHYTCDNGTQKLLETLIKDYALDPCSADDDGNTPLHVSCMIGNAELVRLLCTKFKCPVDVKNKKNETPLLLASGNGYVNIVKMLVVEHKADLSVHDCQNDTSLTKASINGHTEIVRTLIVEFNCSPHVRGFKGRTLLHCACANGHTTLATGLIADFNLDPHSADDSGDTPLHLACINGHEELVRPLISKYNCVVDVRNRRSETPLIIACFNGHCKLVKILIKEFKANVFARDHHNNSVLHKAAMSGDLELVQMLINEFHCNPEIKGFEGRSMLHYACEIGANDILVTLVKDFHLEPCSADDSGNTPLHVSCVNGIEDSVRLLINKYKCLVDVKNKKGDTPLLIASLNGHCNIVRLLVDEFKANIHVCDVDNNTIVHKAALGGHKEMIMLLVTEYHCDVKEKGCSNRSVLHYSCMKGSVTLITSLITEFNLDPTLADEYGNTPLHTASCCGREDLVKQFIITWKCPVDVKNNRKETPLFKACFMGHSNLVKILLNEYKADINVRDYHNSTVLHTAILGGHVDLVLMLIEEFDINPSLADNNGDTPLHICCSHGQQEIAKLLVVKYRCPFNVQNKEGETSFHIACSAGLINTVTMLAGECQENITDLLKIAFRSGNAEIIHAINNTQYGCNEHLLHQVIGDCGSVSILFDLISNFNYDLLSIDNDGNTILHTAALCGRYQIVKVLLDSYSSCFPIDCINSLQQTAFHCACIAGHADVANLLLSKKATVNLRDVYGETALKKAYDLNKTTVMKTISDFFGITRMIGDPFLVLEICVLGLPELIDILLGDFHIDPSQVNDDQGNGTLHIAALHGHVSTAEVLIRYGCPTNYTNYEGQSPLHVACRQEFAEYDSRVFNFFLSKFRAEIFTKDASGDLPIHVAAQAGNTNAITTMVFDYDCSPDTRGYKNQTLLHQALFGGHISTAKALIEIHRQSIHCTDDDGNTPLHLSALFAQTASVRFLLYDRHAPIFVRNKAGKTAFDLSKQESVKKIFKAYMKGKHKTIQEDYESLQSLSLKKYSGECFIARAFVMGNPESGKSTLVESLKRQGTVLSSFLKVSERHVPRHTAGIIVSPYQSDRNGRIMYYDFAGDNEYYSSHSAILEMVSQSSIGISVFIIVSDLRKGKDSICNELGYWLSFISCHAKALGSLSKSHVIIVLSHLDLISSDDSTSILASIKDFLHSNNHELNKRNVIIADVIPSNCCKPRATARIDEILQLVTKTTNPYSLTVQAMLLNGMLEKDFKDVVACQFRDVLDHVKKTGTRLPEIASELYTVVKELHDVGLLMIIGTNTDQIENHIVLINVCSLTNEVHEILFSKSAMQNLSHAVSLQYTKLGIYPESVISSYLPKHITTDCLVQLQYCQRFSHADVGLDCSVTPNTDSDDILLYFPALCNLEREEGSWPGDPNLDYSIGWYAKCKGKLDYLPPRYLHVLLLRLTFMFALPISKSDLEALESSLSVANENCYCTMWKTGIHWLMSEGIECFVEVIDESRGVVIVVKSRNKHAYQCMYMLSQIVNVLTEARSEYCHSVTLQSNIMNSSDPSSYKDEDKLYETSRVKSALLNRDETIISNAGHLTLDLEKLRSIQSHTYWGKY